VLRRLAPWLAVIVIGALLLGVMPSAQAQTGATAADAIPVNSDGTFTGLAGPSQILWYKFNYLGGSQTVTTTLTFVPGDSTRLDFFLFTGDPANPTQFGTLSTLNNNVRTIAYSDAGGPRVVFIKVENDHTDRSVSFVGALTPTSTLATPTPTVAGNVATPLVTPTAGPVAGSAASAITLVSNNGEFAGTLAPGQAVWYHAWYGNPGADMTINVTIAPVADNADLNIYSGTDVTNLGATQQGGSQVRSGQTISRHYNAANSAYIYFSVANNGGTVLAYGGSLAPFTQPPATATPTLGTPSLTPGTPTGTPGTPTPAGTPTATPAPVQQAPAVTHDAQYYSQTGFRVDDAAVAYFQSRGAVDTFGFPISRLFTFLGCPVQMFQRLIIQLCPGQPPTLINTLDPEIFPYTRVNGSVFPSSDEALKAQTPAVTSPNYSTTIMPFIQSVVPDTFNGQPVNFWQTFMKDGALEVMGAPISHPQPDPSNANFIYQRFQRVILHYRQGIGTEPLLLADYLKQIMIGPNAPSLPQDLQQQASSSKFFGQYCKGAQNWICRQSDLPVTSNNLTFAFEQG
jgi:hypothetical protein